MSDTSPPDLDTAIETFARGFAWARSLTFPYVAAPVPATPAGTLWHCRDADRKRAADYRREEWIAHRLEAAEVDRIARAESRSLFCISVIRAAGESADPLKTAYKSLGYRLIATEPVMSHDLKRVPSLARDHDIRQVHDAAMALRLKAAARRHEILPRHLQAESDVRQYVAVKDEQVVGWVKSISIDLGSHVRANWVSNLKVLPAYRRQGIGRAILSRMLRDDRKAGSAGSVLTANHAGALLYPQVGYQQIGELMLFTPIKSRLPARSRTPLKSPRVKEPRTQ